VKTVVSSLGIATNLSGVNQENDVLLQTGQHRRWEIVGLNGAGSNGQDVKIACQSPLPVVEVESVWNYISANLPPERVPQGSPCFAVCPNIPCLSLQEHFHDFNQIIRMEDFLDHLDIGRRAVKMSCKVMGSEYLYLPGSL